MGLDADRWGLPGVPASGDPASGRYQGAPYILETVNSRGETVYPGGGVARLPASLSPLLFPVRDLPRDIQVRLGAPDPPAPSASADVDATPGAPGLGIVLLVVLVVALALLLGRR